jgi:HEAT repeat protein
LLGNPDRQLALVSAWALAHISPTSAEVAKKTLPLLTAGLKDRAALARRGAAEGLGSLGPAAKQAVPALQSAASDKDPAVRAAATKALALIRGREASER